MGTGYSKQKKQAKMLQEQLSKAQTQMQAAEVVGTVGNGLVSITLNGNHEMLKIKIKPECIDPEDAEGLEDLVRQAYMNAASQLKDMPMPGIPGMPSLGSFGF